MSKYCTLAFHQTSVTISNDSGTAMLLSVALNNELEQYVNQNGLRGKKTIAILSSTDYQLLRVKKPETQMRDIVSAMLWQEQAKLFLPVDQLVCDYIESPTVTTATNEKYLYFVATSKRALKEHYQTLREMHLEPIKITIPEFVYGHYSQKNYAAETTVIWVNYFQDTAQVFAFFHGELIATLKLPKLTSATEISVMSEACLTALNLFYMAQIKSFSSSPLWLMNGLFTIEEAMLNQINGRKEWLSRAPNSDYRKALERYNHSSVSHAYYGMLANE